MGLVPDAKFVFNLVPARFLELMDDSTYNLRLFEMNVKSSAIEVSGRLRPLVRSTTSGVSSHVTFLPQFSKFCPLADYCHACI
jgi:hypothetical protein